MPSKFISKWAETFGLKKKIRTNFEWDHRQQYIGMTGGQIVYEKLLEHHVTLVNGVSGGAVLPILDFFHPKHHSGKTPIQFIRNSNEGNSGYVAEGFARVSGKPGVIIVTSGPGLTNLITPLQDAFTDGVPLVAISGQVETFAPPESFQQCYAVSLTKTCTKWNYKLNSVAEIPVVLDYAFHLAVSGRPGPVHIDCPKDLQTTIYDECHMRFIEVSINGVKYNLSHKGKIDFHKINLQPLFDSNQLDRIVAMINSSERPILCVGKGVSDCPRDLLDFAEKTNIPVATTLHGLGSFDERHPLALNLVGMHGHATPNFMMQMADLVLAFGCRFSDRTVCSLASYAPLARDAQNIGAGGFVHVDIRPTERDHVVKVAEFVNSDCRSFLSKINKLNLIYKSRPDWMNIMKTYKTNYPIRIPLFPDGSLSIQRVVQELDTQIDEFRERYIFATGIGVHQLVTAQLITWSKPRSMISSGSAGVMGVGIGFAIGSQLADKSKTVILIDGDGSFNMTNTELKTVMNLLVPIKIMVINNSSDMMVAFYQTIIYDKRYVSTFYENCDYNVLADAYKIHNVYCDNETHLSDKMNEFLAFDGPVLFHVKVQPTPCLPLVKPGKGLDDMIMEDNENTLTSV